MLPVCDETDFNKIDASFINTSPLDKTNNDVQ